MNLVRFICILSAFLAMVASANQLSEDNDTDNFQRISIVPVLGYTEETEFQIGVMSLFFFRPEDKGGKVNEVGITAYGSTRGQFQFSLEPFYYLYHDKIELWSMFRYQNWIASYFGRGNDPDIDTFTNFDRERLQFDFKANSRIGVPSFLKYGIEAHIEHASIKFKKDSPLETPSPHSGFRNGIGYQLALDTRKNTNWSRNGFFIEWSQLFYNKVLGDYKFDTESLDIRAYGELPLNASFALGALWQRANGDVPFDMLSGPDGIKRFRGVESLYFNDNQSLILQAEIRRYLEYRLGTHVFFEAGKAGEYFSDLMRKTFHKSIGIGALLGLNLKETLFARADVSWVDFDHIGLSFYVRQAF